MVGEWWADVFAVPWCVRVVSPATRRFAPLFLLRCLLDLLLLRLLLWFLLYERALLATLSTITMTAKTYLSRVGGEL